MNYEQYLIAAPGLALFMISALAFETLRRWAASRRNQQMPPDFAKGDFAWRTIPMTSWA
jgi:hypothetical protein